MSLSISDARVSRLRTAVSERIPVLLASDDSGPRTVDGARSSVMAAAELSEVTDIGWVHVD